MEQNQCCHHQHEHAECIRIVPIFNHLEDSQMDLIAESAKTLHLKKGEMLKAVPVHNTIQHNLHKRRRDLAIAWFLLHIYGIVVNRQSSVVHRYLRGEFWKSLHRSLRAEFLRKSSDL